MSGILTPAAPQPTTHNTHNAHPHPTRTKKNRYREAYIREAWPLVTRALGKCGVACELNLVEGSMTVRTTRKTSDPRAGGASYFLGARRGRCGREPHTGSRYRYIVVKARDLVKLLARSIPVSQALKILDDGMHCAPRRLPPTRAGDAPLLCAPRRLRQATS